MNTQITKTRSDNQLENLDEKVRANILELAMHSDLKGILDALARHGITTSIPTLSRFVRRHREKLLVAEGREMKPAMDELAERGKEGQLRAGSLEAMRQKMYERVLETHDPEEARLLYAAMVKEEVRLKELEVEKQKVEIAAEELKLKAALAVENGRKRVKGEIVESSAAAAPGIPAAPLQGEIKQLPAASESDKNLRAVVDQALEILNRGGGDVSERFLEARRVLTQGVKGLGAG